MAFYLFTYGTLMQGQCRHAMLESEQFIQDYTIDGVKLFNYYDKDDKGNVQNYPVTMLGDGKNSLDGEIYLCDDILMPYLNKMESVGTLYNVYTFPLEINGKEEEIYIYIGTNMWERYIGTKYLKPYNKSGKWQPTTNK